MALTDTKLRNLRPQAKSFQLADGGGLFIEVTPKGKKVWRMRYWLAGVQEKVKIGSYPAISLIEARRVREEYKGLIERGDSPMRLKAQKKQASVVPDNVTAFAKVWFSEVIEKTNENPRNIRRALEKDVYPAIGNKKLPDVTPADVLAITDRIKARGADQMALQTRNILKRLFAYAIARQKITFNPAAAIEARFIAVARSRDVALTADEIGKLLRAIYASSMKRAFKLALHLLVITMVRKSELTQAKWEEFDFEKREWAIPAERTKKGRAHVVYLSDDALAMFQELKELACGSAYVLPSRNNPLIMPVSKTTLNYTMRGLSLEMRHFVLHDFRRTASTHAHEANFNSDVIEKALGHEQSGVRGVYNRAEYGPQRRELLQWWSRFVEAQIETGRKVVLGRFGMAAAA